MESKNAGVYGEHQVSGWEGSDMRKVSWLCIVAITLSMFTACTRRIEQLDEGLKSKPAEENISRSESVRNYASQDNIFYDEAEIMDSALVHHEVSLFFLDEDNNRLVPENKNLILLSEDLILSEIVKALIKGPSSESLKAVIPENTRLLGIEQDEGIVSVDLSSEFLGANNLLAARVALVNTLTEREGIKYVKIYVEGKELTQDGSLDGEALGILSKYSNNLDEVAANEQREVKKENVKEVKRELFFGDFRYQYLLPEIRTLTVKDGAIIKSIVEELIKGPVGGAEEGLYPTLPGGTRLIKSEIQEGGKDELDVAVLYFSKDLKTAFYEQNSSRSTAREKAARNNELVNKEKILLSSLVYSITSLPNIGAVKIFYEDRDGDIIDSPLYSVSLKNPLSRDNFPNQLGRKIKVYFSDSKVMHLVPEYRAMSRSNLQIATTIINELIRGPQANLGHVKVIPEGIEVGDIRVWMADDGETAVVDLPSKLDGNKMGSTGVLMTLYAIVNSLTDPCNTHNIKKVKFLVDGQSVDTFGNMELSQPFIRNPAIIQE